MPKNLNDILHLMQSFANFPAMSRSGPAMFEDYEDEREAGSEKQAVESSRKPMIYTLTIDCVCGSNLVEPCQRVIEVKSNSTLQDLHYAIQKAVAFDDDHCFEFYIGRTYRNRSILFSESDGGPFDDTFTEFQLARIWPLPRQMQLFYWFDFGDDWKFRIRKARGVKPPVKGKRYPLVTKEVGPNPMQYPDFE